MLVFASLLGGSFNIADFISEGLFSLTLFLLFKKCAVKPWLALIPFVRMYYLGKCADRKPEGKMAALLDLLSDSLMLAFYYARANTFEFYWIGALSSSVAMISIIYRIRVYIGICEIFERSKLWVISWFLFPFIPAGIWGFFGKYQPAYTVPEMEAENAARISGTYVEALDNGLSVNIEARTARQLFDKKYLLRDIHLIIPPGHMVLLLGGSGAGKTTLINAINGYEKARAKVVLNGNNVYRQYKEMMHEIGYVPQRDLMRDNDCHCTLLRTDSKGAGYLWTGACTEQPGGEALRRAEEASVHRDGVYLESHIIHSG